MDRLQDLEKILTAARDLGKNLQNDVDKLRADNEQLQAQNKRLQAENEKLKSDTDNLIDEMETLENVVKDLRAANETFGVNLNRLMGQLNQAINDSHEKFMAQINALMRDEFQKFLAEYMNKVKAGAEQNTTHKPPHDDKNAKKKKSAEVVSETAVVSVDTKSGVTTAKAEVLTPDLAGENKS
ncbi:MAG: hypothetical protein IJU91_03645, partial [Selenomonadaceae bacterium]|nr:hypothetical protein [Selenomonadaceae bacterium]